MRTIIISDAHGYPQLITNALEAAEYHPAHDVLIYAGDLVDRGPDPVGCFDLIDELADVIVLGNHDIALMFGLDVTPKDPHASVLAPVMKERVMDTAGRWVFAHAIDEILITHGGVSETWRDVFEACDQEVDAMAELLTDCCFGEIELLIDDSCPEWGDGVLGFGGPLWFRPLVDYLPMVGLRQIVGHTPIEFYGSDDAALIETLGVTLVDPGAYRFVGSDEVGGHFRCAVIEGESVEMLQAGLRGSVFARRPRSLLSY